MFCKAEKLLRYANQYCFTKGFQMQSNRYKSLDITGMGFDAAGRICAMKGRVVRPADDFDPEDEGPDEDGPDGEY